MFLGDIALGDFKRVMDYARTEVFQVRRLLRVITEGTDKRGVYTRFQETGRLFPRARVSSTNENDNSADRFQQSTNMVLGVPLTSQVSVHDIVRRGDGREFKVVGVVPESTVQTERQFLVTRQD